MASIPAQRPPVLQRALAVWIGTTFVVGIASSLAPSDEERPQRVASDVLPPVEVTVPSIPPITVPGVDLPPITVPPMGVEVDLDVDLPQGVAGPVVDLIGGTGSPLDMDRAGLWLVDADTGSARVLFNDLLVNDVAFSPDGRRAAVTTWPGQSRHGSQPLTMWVVDLTTGVRHVVAGPVVGLGGQSWSRDGKLIAYSDYWTSPDGPFDEYVDGIWVVRPDGTGRRRVAGTDQYGGHMSWSPDSRYVTASLFNDDRVLVAGVADGTERRFPATDAAYAEWAADGSLLAVSTTFDGPLLTMDPATGATRTVATDLWGPVWSPDSRWIAANGDDPDEGVFVLRPDGSQRRHLTDGELLDWSTDGRFVLVGGYGRGSSVVDVQSGQTRAVSNPPREDLDWRPEGFVPGTHRAAVLVWPEYSPPPPGL